MDMAIRGKSLISFVQLSLLVTEVPQFKKRKVDTYQSKRDLIDCNMASVHLVSRFCEQQFNNSLLLLLMSFENSPGSSTVSSLQAFEMHSALTAVF
jgi:hypothetical protein